MKIKYFYLLNKTKKIKLSGETEVQFKFLFDYQFRASLLNRQFLNQEASLISFGFADQDL